MNTLYRRTDEPLLEAGITGLTMVDYVDISDPTRLWHSQENKPSP